MKMIDTSADKQSSWLIFTDLDGSLLDHHTYSYSAAEKLLATLEQHSIPVIFNTSKTSAEIKTLRKTIGNIHPFISENGSAVFIPVNYFPCQPENTQLQDDYWVYSTSKPRTYWLSLLDQAEQYFSNQFTCFSALSDQDIVKITGLSHEAAQLAKQRQFSEPVIWLSNDKSRKTFIDWLSNNGANVLQGGRFLHVSGNSNKGQSLQWLAQQYQHYSDGHYTTIALGDSNNDIAMLEQSDKAVIIHNPATIPFELERHNCTFKTHQSASNGWVEGITHFLPFL